MAQLFDMANHPAAAFLIEVVIVTSLILIVGEITPKIYASKRPVRVARFMARPLRFLNGFFKPLSKLLVNSTSFMDKHLEKKKGEISMCQVSNTYDKEYDYGRVGWMSERFAHCQGLLTPEGEEGRSLEEYFQPR